MEDCKINYDYTVRNAAGSIVQFLYGEDGIDPVKIESQMLPYIELDYVKLCNEYLWTEDDDTMYYLIDKPKQDTFTRLKAHFDQLLVDREFMIQRIFHNKKETSIYYPISFFRIITIAKSMFQKNIKPVLSDLDPEYVMDTIEELCETLYLNKANKGNKFLNILLRVYLSPKKVCFEYRFDKLTFDYVVKTVKMRFYDSIANPSEMVGVVAAQSIGEPTTQLTLNSVDWQTDMLFDINGKLVRTKIGEFIDNELEINTNKETHPNDTTLGWTKEKNIKVLSCSESGEISWKLVEAVTKHPPINTDGSNTLLKVITHSGREVIATKAKSFLKRVDNKIIQVKGEDIKVGDYLPVSNTFPIINTDSVDISKYTYEYGVSIGLELAKFDRLPLEFYQGPKEFAEGIYDGYFKENVNISREILDDLQLLLTKHGIQSKIENNMLSLINLDIIPNIITETYGDITIQRLELEDYIAKCKNEKDLEIFKNIAQENIVYDKIESITEIPSSHTHVYDLTVQDTRNFNSYNSLCLADTFHSSGISSASKTVRGVPRIKELLSVTKNIKSPSLTIYIKDEAKTNKKACTDILNSIQTTYFKDVVSSSKIYFDPDDFNTTIDDDKLFLATYKEFMNQGLYQASNLSPWLLRLEFSRDKLHENNITMMDIHYVLHEFYEDTISAMFSDDNSNNLVCRIKLVESEKTDESDMITELKALEKSILENIVIKGIKNINKVMMNKKDDMTYNSLTMQFESSYEWVLDTNGTNLLDILCNSKIDNTRTISNDINEIYETLGIEAARHVLFSELSETLAGLYVNYRHLSLLVDTMTNKGYLLSIDRHGINRIDIGPLAKCSFEESVDMVIKAGMFSEIDKINGVSANIMLGQIPPAGTGDTDILIDEQRLLELEGEEEEDYELEMDTNQTSYAFDDEAKENICSNLNIEFEMPDIDKSFVEQKMDLSIKIV